LIFIHMALMQGSGEKLSKRIGLAWDLKKNGTKWGVSRARRRPDARRHVVLALAEDKDVDGILRHLVAEAAMMVLTAWEGPRASDPQQLADSARRHAADSGEAIDIHVERDSIAAIRLAASGLREEDIVLVLGSHMLAGSVLRLAGETDGPDLFRRE